MKVSYNITQNKFNVSFKTGYYPLPVGLENYYTKNETDLLLENYYLKTETYNQNEVDSLFLNETLDTVTERGNTTANEITVGGLTTKYVQLDTTSVNTYNIGKVYWNADKGTYNFGLKNNVELQLGQEQNVYGKAYSAITNGQLVMYRTSQGGHILFEPANFTQLSSNPDLIIGVATQNIALNEFGYITTFGEVNTLNTSSFADGNTLYFGSGNILQNTVPSGSYFIIGRVNRAHATQGSIFVKPYFVDNNLESKLNKQNNLTSDSDGTKYPTVNAVVGGLATKLEKGTYTGTASDLKSLIDTKINGSGTDNYVSKFTASGTIANSIVYDNGTNLGISTTSPSEKLDVNGYTKATGFKTPSGTATQSLTANGGTFDLNIKADLVDGKVPSSQLPSYVDDVLEFANLASFPATGESGKIYIAIDTNITYRWTGTGYAEISASLALGETASTAYRGDRGKIAYDHSQTTGNPHNTTKSDIGLGNVDNTSDLNKPISTATQTALNSKQDNLGYTPENIANKSDSYTSSSSTTYASTKALVDGLATKQNILTNPIIGTGTTNYIPKFTASGTIANSIVYDNGTNVGIGTTSPSSKLHISGTASYITITDITYNRTSKIGYRDNANLYLDNDSNSNTYIGAYNNVFLAYGGGIVGIGTTSPSEKLEVNGKIKDSQGILKAQRTIVITGDITLSETHNGAYLRITNTCNITIPTDLDANFQCFCYAKGSVIATFVNGGVTLNAPDGLLLKSEKKCSLLANASNNLDLLGELATS